MKGLTIIITLMALVCISQSALAQKRYGQQLCDKSDYSCIKVKQGDTWESLFPYPEERDIVRRVNRMNIRLRAGMNIAVPKNIERLTTYDVAPFPRYIETNGEKTIYVSQKELAWGAFDESGELVWWGPLSSGSGKCSKNDNFCKTPGGAFRVIRKQDIDCISTAFPRRANGDHGGAEMPYCMHFFRGFALHGSYTVPGYRASHGCVRMFIEDARWLNEEFIDLPGAGGAQGTRVVVESVDN
jgi:hypothetical protein